jgi:hypothetical protein
MDNGLFGGEKTTTDEGRILLASSVSCRVCLVAGLVGLWAPVFFFSLLSLAFLLLLSVSWCSQLVNWMYQNFYKLSIKAG